MAAFRVGSSDARTRYYSRRCSSRTRGLESGQLQRRYHVRCSEAWPPIGATLAASDPRSSLSIQRRHTDRPAVRGPGRACQTMSARRTSTAAHSVSSAHFPAAHHRGSRVFDVGAVRGVEDRGRRAIKPDSRGSRLARRVPIWDVGTILRDLEAFALGGTQYGEQQLRLDTRRFSISPQGYIEAQPARLTRRRLHSSSATPSLPRRQSWGIRFNSIVYFDISFDAGNRVCDRPNSSILPRDCIVARASGSRSSRRSGRWGWTMRTGSTNSTPLRPAGPGVGAALQAGADFLKQPAEAVEGASAGMT